MCRWLVLVLAGGVVLKITPHPLDPQWGPWPKISKSLFKICSLYSHTIFYATKKRMYCYTLFLNPLYSTHPIMSTTIILPIHPMLHNPQQQANAISNQNNIKIIVIFNPSVRRDCGKLDSYHPAICEEVSFAGLVINFAPVPTNRQTIYPFLLYPISLLWKCEIQNFSRAVRFSFSHVSNI